MRRFLRKLLGHRVFFTARDRQTFKTERDVQLSLYALVKQPGWVVFKANLMNHMVDLVTRMGENVSKEDVLYSAGVAKGLSLVVSKATELEVTMQAEMQERLAGRQEKDEIGPDEKPDIIEQ